MSLPIQKTPKCYVGGAFIRSESGRVHPLSGHENRFLANIPLCSRKDLRQAVEAAAQAGPGWSKRSPYNRGQILYRIAEMMESRADELTAAISLTNEDPSSELRAAIDRIVHYAGWADKFEQVLGSVNPVASPHFNFTVSEPMGVVGVIAPPAPPLLALLSLILPVIVSGNTVVSLSSHLASMPSLLLGEILAVSDLPGGVVNILTGCRDELSPVFSTHAQIRAIHASADRSQATLLETHGADSVKRIHLHPNDTEWFSLDHESPYAIRHFTEAKTVWHPIGI